MFSKNCAAEIDLVLIYHLTTFSVWILIFPFLQVKRAEISLSLHLHRSIICYFLVSKQLSTFLTVAWQQQVHSKLCSLFSPKTFTPAVCISAGENWILHNNTAVQFKL